MEELRFDPDRYEVRNLELEGKKIVYREYKDILYCRNPLDPIQKMNLFVPEAYYQEGHDLPYDLHTAPIFMSNTVGGYMPGPADEPGIDSHKGSLNLIFLALEHGYVVASAGVRGRTSGKKTTEFFEGSKEGILNEETGRMVGRAPAFIVDLKAAIRYLRYNKDLIPGDPEKIITNGTSAGGALSALAGASGNSPDYETYLKQIGAVEERDEIFAASCYCPIHNLEHADSAYEWQFCGLNDYHRTKHQRLDDGSIIRVPDEGMMNDKQIEVSKQLKKLFPSYLNSLDLHNLNGKALELDENGEGSFKDYVKSYVLASADKEYRTLDTQKKMSGLMVQGSEIENQDYLLIEKGRVRDLDFERYVRKISRMKAAPAFDALDLSCPENEEFGDERVDGRHFTKFSHEHSTVDAELADQKMIDRMNPLSFILKDHNGICKNWRIRHGAFDRDTSLAIPVILATALRNKGYDVDFCLPWGLPHSGEYDPEELFAWIDGLCLKSQ